MVANLAGQEPWELRGANDARLAALETRTAGPADWTPVITQDNEPDQTVQWAHYARVGPLVIAHFAVSFQQAGTGSNNIVLSGLPATAANTLAVSGSFWYFDAGSTVRAGTIRGNTTTTALFVYDGFGNSMGNGDFAIASGDSIRGVVIMEAAS